jgi:hypothetical protein
MNEETIIQIIQGAYDRGLRVSTLGPQPAYWLEKGLERLEKGQSLTVEDIKRFNRAGGVDHPDPTLRSSGQGTIASLN